MTLKKFISTAIVGLVLLIAGSNVRAQEPAGAEKPAQHYFTDVELINQNGEKMKFYSDLLKDKVVIINEGQVVLEEDMATLTRGASLEDVFLRSIAKDRGAAA